MDIDILLAIALGNHLERLAILQAHRSLREERATKDEHTVRGVHLVEAQRRHDVPSGHLTTVLITNHTLRLVGVEDILDIAHLLRGLPLLTGIGIEVSHMMARLVTMCILTDQTTDVGRGTLTHITLYDEE